MSYCLIQGDSKDVLKTFPENYFDSVVCDPPYGLSFMGKAWDYDVPQADLWREVLRVMKPGAYLVACNGSRTYHRGVVQIEDAGFIIHPLIGWLFGQGMPKATRVDIPGMEGFRYGLQSQKPALEPICMAQKPFSESTGTENILRWGTGAVNIDACRIPTDELLYGGSSGLFSHVRDGKEYPRGRSGNESCERLYNDQGSTNYAMTPGPRGGDKRGRWPANLIHDGSEEVLACFPQVASGKPCGVKAGGQGNAFGKFEGGIPVTGFGDTGSAARFFYCAKASRQDRNEGLERFDKKNLYWSSGEQNPGSLEAAGTDRTSQNNWPTVKPTTLMRYLLRLVTPPGGATLDPFTGSGSTGKAAMLEGFNFIGIELQPLDIAGQRIAWAGYGATRLERERQVEPQISLFE